MALAFLRRHRSWFNWFLVVVIAAFIWLYVPAFSHPDRGSAGEVLAEVGGLPITASEFQRAYIRQRQRMQQMYGGQLDPAMLERLGVREQVLASLVEQRLVRLEAERLGLSVDDQAVIRALTQSPAFQENGRFLGTQEIRRRLDLQGVSEEEFTESVRSQLLAERLQSLLTDGVTVTPEEVEREFRRRNEQVKVEYALVSADKYKPEIAVTDGEIKQRFEAHREEYRIPEKRVVSYLLVDSAAQQARAVVTDRDVELYYQDHRDEFKEEEQACARHILVKVKASAEATEGHSDDEARKLAQAALDQVRSGADFAAVAKKVSEDTGSASQGGDLGCFPRGRMVPEFENVAFSLEPGQVSDLVKTTFGYHVIKLESRREEKLPALSEVKDRIRQTLVTQKASALTSEKVSAVADALGRGKGLDDVARAHGLVVQKSAPLARGETPAVLDSPTLVARAFDLKRGEIASEPFAVSAGYAFVGLPEPQASRLPELKEVQDKVRADVAREKAFARAREIATQLRVRAEKEGLEKAAAAVGAVRKETPSRVSRGDPLGDLGVNRTLEEAAFSLPDKTLSEPLRAASGYAVLRVLERKPFDPAALEAQKAQITASLREQKGERLFRAYMNEARRRFPVERRPAAIQRVMG